MKVSKIVEDLVLLLIYLTSWKEKVTDEAFILRAWKGYDFNTLNNLKKRGYIEGSLKSKSVYLTDKGVEKAKKLSEVLFRKLRKGMCI